MNTFSTYCHDNNLTFELSNKQQLTSDTQDKSCATKQLHDAGPSLNLLKIKN